MIEKGYVSVIVPTYNAEKLISRCLSSIRNQSYKKVEIILVDQSSPDKTVTLAKKYADKIILREKPQFYSPPAKSRNMGAAEAKGEYLMNIDADMELPTDLIKHCVEKISLENASALVIHEQDIGLNFWARCRALEKDIMRKDPYMEAARFVRRDVFDAVGGYDSDLGSGEDWDIHARIKNHGTIAYSDIPLKHHTGKKHLFENAQKMVSYGRTFDKYVKKHPVLSKKQLTPFRPMYLRNWKMLARRPILAGGLFILKFSEFSSAFVGLIYTKLIK